MPIDSQDITAGTNDAVGDIVSRYNNGTAVNSAIYGNLSEFDLEDDVESYLTNHAQNQTTFWDQFYVSQPEPYFESAVSNFKLGIAEVASTP